MLRISIIACFMASAFLSADAFSPSLQLPSSSRTTQLFMDKKKTTKKSGAKAKPQGFGSAMGMPSAGFPYAGTVTPGVQSPQRVVVEQGIVKPDYSEDGVPKKRSTQLLPWIVEVKTPEEIVKMRAAGKLAREILDLAGRAVAVGVTTDEIDTLVYEAIVKVCWGLSYQGE
jgi:methionyl aminopeptidase